jgi:uncharacterized protein involved in cysteine biosynthesis
MGRVMFAALRKAIAQCSDPKFRSVLLRSVGLSLVVFIILWIVAGLGLAWLGGWLFDWLVVKGVTGTWLDILEWVLGALSLAGVLFASFILFPAVMVMIMSILLEEIAEAVERHHYPGLPPGRAQPIGEMLRSGLAFAAVTVGLNLLVLPFYLLLLFVPPLNLFLFYGLNGYLFGREYFEIVALRRLDAPDAKRMRRRFRGRLFLAGAMIAFMMTVPLVNLFAPIVATGFMVHIFEALRSRNAAAAT